MNSAIFIALCIVARLDKRVSTYWRRERERKSEREQERARESERERARGRESERERERARESERERERARECVKRALYYPLSRMEGHSAAKQGGPGTAAAREQHST